jgi:pSer/pThr/pTyr-binding forkhead associated (FHA) protein
MSGPRDGYTYQFKLGAQDHLIITFGRRDTCEIVLAYDSQVSRTHARLIYDARDMEYFLEDAGSRNGTFIESRRIEAREPLKPGSLFRVGRTWLRLDAPLDPFSPHEKWE